MIGHTGFLLFARHQERSLLWDDHRASTLGTRERKQEAARRERLGIAPFAGMNDAQAEDARDADDALDAE